MSLLINNVTSTLSSTFLLKQVSATILSIILPIYSYYNNNHSQSFPIYRYFPHAFQAIQCYPTPKKNPSIKIH